MRYSAGFSILEMITTLAIVAVLLAVAVPKLFENSGSRLTMAARMIRSDIAAVQRTAIDRGIAAEIEFSSDGYLVRWAGSGAAVTLGGRFPVTDLSEEFGVEITGSGTVTFSSLGEPVSDSLDEVNVRLESDPGSSKKIVIERYTGHARVE